MSNIYEQPNADLLQPEEVEFTFSNLGIWRKIYLALNWLVGIAFLIAMVIGLAEPAQQPDSTDSLIMVLLTLLYLAFCLWVHIAICKRKLGQLIALIVIQIFPLFNPVSALIFWAIYSTSKKEVG